MNRWPIRLAVGVAAIVAAAAEGTPQPAAVSAQGWFLGVGIGAMDYTEPSYSTNALDYLYLQGGWRFNRYLAIDARAGAEVFPYYDLTTQVGLYLSRTGNHASSNALYVVWIGANDLKDALGSLAVDPSFATAVGIIQQALGTTAANVQALWAAGARRFLILDMPDLGVTPYIIGLGPLAQYVAGQLTNAYNGGLGQAQAALGVLPGIQITRFDVNATLDAAVAAPAASGIQDFYIPCLTFGVVERAVCGHPEQFLFWDAIHPTRAGHNPIAAGALATLTVH